MAETSGRGDDGCVSDAPRLPVRRDPTPAQRTALSLLDVALGATSTGAAAAYAVGHRLGVVVRPVASIVLRPPLVPEGSRPATWLAALAREGGRLRGRLAGDLADLLDLLVPALTAEALRRLDLTDVVTRSVDLDRVVAEVDIEAVVERIDLTRVVREQVDLDLLVATVDLDAAAARLDLDAAVGRVDLDAIIARIDLAGLAEEVIAAIDLPEIIRESTGSVASDTVRGFRMQGISADEAVARAVDRIRLRRGHRGPPVPPPGPTPTAP
jgi:hypothetical protein